MSDMSGQYPEQMLNSSTDQEVWVTKLLFVFSKAEFDKLILNHVSQA